MADYNPTEDSPDDKIADLFFGEWDRNESDKDEGSVNDEAADKIMGEMDRSEDEKNR